MSMEQRDGGVAAEATMVARQLDFTVNSFTNSNDNALVSSLFPEHLIDQLQSKWLDAARISQNSHVNARHQSPSRPVAQTKLPPRKMVMPPRSPHRELPQLEGKSKSPLMVPRLAHPVEKLVQMPERAVQPLIKMESPKPRERSNLDLNEGTPKKQKQCRCKNSRCLKLYCECFASGVYCDGCNCVNCFNKKENDADRKEAIEAILERKPDAFYGVDQIRGCNCRRTGCLKKYCECFQANIPCSDKCKCMDCKNFEGSEERNIRLYHHQADSVRFIQQANAAVHGAIGTPSKKHRIQQIGFFVASARQFTNCRPESHQDNFLTSDALYSPSSFRVSNPDPTKLELPKAPYKSPLSGILHIQHVMDFCKLLVDVSTEATKSLSEKRKTFDDGIDMNRTETSVGYHEDRKDHQSQQHVEESSGNQGCRDVSFCESDGYDIQNRRPLSPGTLALMCDERDATFMAPNDPSTITDTKSNIATTSNLSSEHSHNQLYVEQERLVLTKFSCFLNRLITRGSIEETRAEQENPKNLWSKGV